MHRTRCDCVGFCRRGCRHSCYLSLVAFHFFPLIVRAISAELVFADRTTMLFFVMSRSCDARFPKTIHSGFFLAVSRRALLLSCLAYDRGPYIDSARSLRLGNDTDRHWLVGVSWTENLHPASVSYRDTSIRSGCLHVCEVGCLAKAQSEIAGRIEADSHAWSELSC